MESPENPGRFNLIDELYEVYRDGHTAPLAAFRQYFVTREDSQPKVMRAHGIMRNL